MKSGLYYNEKADIFMWVEGYWGFGFYNLSFGFNGYDFYGLMGTGTSEDYFVYIGEV